MGHTSVCGAADLANVGAKALGTTKGDTGTTLRFLATLFMGKERCCQSESGSMCSAALTVSLVLVLLTRRRHVATTGR